MRINRHPLTALLVGLTAVAALTACTTTVSGNPIPQTGHSSGTAASSATSAAPGAASPSQNGQGGNHRAITLGDLDHRVDATSVGAPFDPCAVGWAAFPAEVRPSKSDAKPMLRPPRGDDNFTVACRYDNGDTVDVKVDENGNASSTTGKDFLALVVWGKPGQLAATPADMPGSTPSTFGGKQGLLKPGKDSKGNVMCVAVVHLANGGGGVSVTNGRFPAVDTCTIAKSVADAIAAATP